MGIKEYNEMGKDIDDIRRHSIIGKKDMKLLSLHIPYSECVVLEREPYSIYVYTNGSDMGPYTKYTPGDLFFFFLQYSIRAHITVTQQYSSNRSIRKIDREGSSLIPIFEWNWGEIGKVIEIIFFNFAGRRGTSRRWYEIEDKNNNKIQWLTFELRGIKSKRKDSGVN